MALIHCPECNKEVSDRAYACPNCGFPIADYLQEAEAWEEETQEVPSPSCPICGTALSVDATTCPGCGFPVKEYLQEGGDLNTPPPQKPEPIPQGPRCPVCGSRNLSRISGGAAVAKALLLGVAAAGDVGKSWRCEDCGSRF